MSQLMVHQCCHVLASHKVGGITFHSPLVCFLFCVCVNFYGLVLRKCCVFVSGHTHTYMQMQSSCLGMDTDYSDM